MAVVSWLSVWTAMAMPPGACGTEFATAKPASAVVWTVDPQHSRVSFSVRHFTVSRVRGQFNRFTGTVSTTGDGLGPSQFDATTDAASVDSDQPQRDAHLRSAEFFDVAKYPTMQLSGRVPRARGDTLTVDGSITIRGICKPVVFEAVRRRPSGLGDADTRLAFILRATINRTDFGIVWNRMIVGDEVDLELDIELIRPSPVDRPIR